VTLLLSHRGQKSGKKAKFTEKKVSLLHQLSTKEEEAEEGSSLSFSLSLSLSLGVDKSISPPQRERERERKRGREREKCERGDFLLPSKDVSTQGKQI